MLGLLRKWHPDRHVNADDSVRKDAERITKSVNEAYEVIERAGFPGGIPKKGASENKRRRAGTSPVKTTSRTKQVSRTRSTRPKPPARSTIARAQLAIYRLKPSTDLGDAFAGALDLDKHPDLQSVPVSLPDTGFTARLVVRHPAPELPDWFEFLEGVSSNLEGRLVRNAANSAALVLASGTARYAIAFGYGRSLLAPAAIERNFGLKVALALIDPESMMSVGFKEVESTTFFSNRQSNRKVRFRDFRVDTTAAMLSGVAGLPESPDTNYTKAIGADALHINPAIRATELPKLLSWIEKLRTDAKYKKLGFDWIDQVNAVRDPAKVEDLRRALDAALASGGKDVFLGPPEPIDHLRVANFSIVGLRKETLDEVTLSDVKRARNATLLDTTELREARVVALDSGGERLQTWSAFEWVGWSTQTAATTYLLQAGVFYEIDRRLETTLDKYLQRHVRAVPSSWPDWPMKKGQHEDVYNALLTQTLGSKAALLDKNLLRKHFSGRGALEVCDVLEASTKLRFIAVKKFGGASAVSHVIAQSLNGVIAVLDDDALRAELADKLTVGHATQAALKNLSAETAAIYVLLLTPGARRKVNSFPFFAKLSLVRAMKEATTRGIEMFVGTRSMTESPRRAVGKRVRKKKRR